ncbi:MAG TPA: hypothetical protein VK436_02340 [Methanocella sp.]|nr:hypothetical protein [Methanocella sp.]
MGDLESCPFVLYSDASYDTCCYGRNCSGGSSGASGTTARCCWKLTVAASSEARASLVAAVFRRLIAGLSGFQL